MIKELIRKENKRQNDNLELIASENFTSKAVREAAGSILTNKYAEGYPNKRYYGGCEFIDKIEQYAIDKACELFNVKYANVQPHSGSQANAAAYKGLEKYCTEHGKLNKDEKMKILTMDLNSGSHLSHGSPVSFSSKYFNFDFFNLGQDGKLDFKIIEDKIKEFKPHVLLTGYSAYPYEINFSGFKSLAEKYDCMLMVDMAHIAGIVAAGLTSNPCKYADIVTSTTHKTLRGPRGGIILTNNEELIRYVNSAVFPFYQGGPLEHVIAGKAVCFEEALKPEFTNYISQVLMNTTTACNTFMELGAKVIGTENHLFLLDTLNSYGLTGIEAQKLLEKYKITTNKNMLPGDTQKPNTTSGLRIGFAAITTRGCNIELAEEIAKIIHKILSNKADKNTVKEISKITNQLKKVEKI